MNVPVKRYVELLANYLRPQWRSVLLLLILLFGNIGLQLFTPQIMRQFIDTVLAGGAMEQLTLLALLFIVLALLQQVASVVAIYFSQNVGWIATNMLRLDFAKHLLNLDMSFHNTHKPGELIERIDGDMTALANFFSQLVVQVFGSLVFLVGVLLMLFREDWRVGTALTLFVVLTLFAMVKVRGIGVPHWKANSKAGADLYGFLEERLAGTQDIRANGATAFVMRQFIELTRDWYRKYLKARLMSNLLVNTIFLLMAVGNAVAFIVGAYLFQAGVLKLGAVYLIFQYTTMLMRPIEQLTGQLEELQKATASISRLGDLLEIEPKVNDGPGVALPQGPLAVRFEQVTFTYPDGEEKEPVLRDLNFEVQPGRVLGLLGRTGSGKTTISRLVLRLFDATEGRILLGSGAQWADLCNAKQRDLRQHIAMVTQNVQLFHANIRDNLTFFDRSIPDSRILATLDDLGMMKWYQSLPLGLDTKLASGGGGLSAGEGQLLAFARIFLRDPGLVILDEASSRLDPATEQRIERAIDKLLYQRTAIIIAHRLSTVQRADEIMILDGGRILEHGQREQLAADPASRFHQLLVTGLEEVLS